MSSPPARQVPSDLTVAPPNVTPDLLSRDGADKRSTKPFRKGGVGSILTVTSKFVSLLIRVIHTTKAKEERRGKGFRSRLTL